MYNSASNLEASFPSQDVTLTGSEGGDICSGVTDGKLQIGTDLSQDLDANVFSS